jgi:hypothetical protein
MSSEEGLKEWEDKFKVCLLVQYIVERHGKTLLPQYLGMYRLTVDGVEHYLVAMRNVFSNHLQTHRYIYCCSKTILKLVMMGFCVTVTKELPIPVVAQFKA